MSRQKTRNEQLCEQLTIIAEQVFIQTGNVRSEGKKQTPALIDAARLEDTEFTVKVSHLHRSHIENSYQAPLIPEDKKPNHAICAAINAANLAVLGTDSIRDISVSRNHKVKFKDQISAATRWIKSFSTGLTQTLSQQYDAMEHVKEQKETVTACSIICYPGYQAAVKSMIQRHFSDEWETPCKLAG